MLRICQSEIFAEIGPHRPKNSRFSSSDSFRVILIADEIETRYDFITSCMVVLVVPNCSTQLFQLLSSHGCPGCPQLLSSPQLLSYNCVWRSRRRVGMNLPMTAT